MESIQLEISILPIYDSPKNILNLLNDDCIQIILRKLTNIRDFFSASKTCRRFQENAKQCFPRNFKEIKINDHGWFIRALPTKHALSFLNIFGHLISSLDLFHNSMLKLTQQYCSKTLSKLDLCCINKKLFDLSMFQALEEVKIRCCSVNKLHLPTTLKILKLNYIELENDRIEWNPKQELPKLGVVEFCDVNLNDTEFITFLSLTPQLQRLKIVDCEKLITYCDDPSHVFAAIGNLVPNLVDLKIIPRYDHMRYWKSQNYKIEWAPIMQLQRLKCLYLYNPEPIGKLIELLAEHAIPIEEFAFKDRYFYTENIQRLLKLKQLEKLIIKIDEIIPSDDFVQMVKELPALTDIDFKTRTITPQQIVKALKYGKNLNRVKIIVNHFDINMSEYYSISQQLIKRYLNIIALRGNIDIAESNDENERFDIEYGESVREYICEEDLTYDV